MTREARLQVDAGELHRVGGGEVRARLLEATVREERPVELLEEPHRHRAVRVELRARVQDEALHVHTVVRRRLTANRVRIDDRLAPDVAEALVLVSDAAGEGDDARDASIPQVLDLRIEESFVAELGERLRDQSTIGLGPVLQCRMDRFFTRRHATVLVPTISGICVAQILSARGRFEEVVDPRHAPFAYGDLVDPLGEGEIEDPHPARRNDGETLGALRISKTNRRFQSRPEGGELGGLRQAMKCGSEETYAA